MQWKPPSDRAMLILLSPIIFPVVVIGLLMVGIAAPFYLSYTWLDKRFGIAYKPSNDWESWYAWRPVKAEVDPFPCMKWFWLEPVERRYFYGRTLYQHK